MLQLTTAQPGSDRAFSRVGESRMIIAHALQALLPGSSQPYYGDEIAMENGVQVSDNSPGTNHVSFATPCISYDI